jgi:micrococcal nuclease
MTLEGRRWARSCLIGIACCSAVGGAAGVCPAQSLDSQIRAEVDRYVQTVNSGDPEALAALYLRSGTVGSLGDGYITRGWDSVATLLQGLYNRVGSIRMSVDSVRVTPLGPDAAVAFFRYRWVYGRGARPWEAGAMTIVFERVDGRWWVAHDHTSALAADAPEALPAPAHPADGPPRPVRETTACLVTRVTDGDTIECRGIGRVRLIGMDTPELSQGRIGTLATQALMRMIPVGSTAELERDVEARDRYDRLLAYVWTHGILVNWVMVRQGWAVVLTYPPNVQYVDWLEAAQRAAREEGVGLWAIDGFRCLPRDRRAGRCE